MRALGEAESLKALVTEFVAKTNVLARQLGFLKVEEGIDPNDLLEVFGHTAAAAVNENSVVLRSPGLIPKKERL
jgi:hypothetical protein